MDKGKGAKALATSLQNLDLNPPSNVKSKSSISITHPQFPGLLPMKTKPPSLVSLCIGVLGRHLEDIIADLSEIAINLPADIKIAVAAIARRRKLLNDDILIALADTSWEILDVSGSDVSDFGLIKAAEVCRFIKALDISRCTKITANGISELVKHCRLLETLRCGGCPRSDNTARRCLGIFKPKFDDYVEEDSWEELDTKEIASGAQSLRWLVWPNIDKNSLEDFSTECPRVVVNPKSSPFGFKGTEVPQEALQNILLDDEVVKDIDPRTWTMHGFALKPMSPSLSSTELSVAEKFRLAFVERDNRLAPKRAKNARQHQRRAVRELMLISTRAKAMVLASQSATTHSRTQRRNISRVNVMWKRGLVGAVGGLRRPYSSGGGGISSSVNSMLLRSLKDHYQEVAKMNMPPKVSAPSPFTIVKGALDSHGPVLKRSYGNEEVSIYVMRLLTPEDEDSAIDQLFIHVDVSKPQQNESLIFLCGLYEDALGIHSVSMRPKVQDSGYLLIPSQYTGPVFAELDEKMRDAFHSYIEERGVNESLFKFLQAWLYVKEHRNLMRWFKTMGLFVDGKKPVTGA